MRGSSIPGVTRGTTAGTTGGEEGSGGTARFHDPRIVSYGDQYDQFMQIHPPAAPQTDPVSTPVPVCMVIHGGYWKSHYTLDNACIDTLPGYMTRRGWWVVVLEYRRVPLEQPRGDPGEGGFPASNVDVLLALQKIYTIALESHREGAEPAMDLARVVILGHSAGKSSKPLLMQQRAEPS